MKPTAEQWKQHMALMFKEREDAKQAFEYQLKLMQDTYDTVLAATEERKLTVQQHLTIGRADGSALGKSKKSVADGLQANGIFQVAAEEENSSCIVGK